MFARLSIYLAQGRGSPSRLAPISAPAGPWRTGGERRTIAGMVSALTRSVPAGRWLAMPLAIASLGLAACGDDDADQAERTVGPDVDRTVSAPRRRGQRGDPHKTHLTIPTGDVLSGSVIGDSRFCRGGTFRDEDGNPEVRRCSGRSA